MSHRIDCDGVVYDLDSPAQERIGVADKGRYGIVLDEDVHRSDGRYEAARESVADVLARAQRANQRLGGLLIELLNVDEQAEQAMRLREVGQHLGTLSAQCFARAAEVEGRCVEPSARVVIDARDQTPGRCG